MTIQLSRYETWELDAMVEQLERPNPWLLRTFFGRSKFFDTKQIEFDIVDRGRRMAPFVAPTVAGKPMVREGYRTRTLTPAYIKPTALVRPGEAFTRLPGEGAYGGVMTPKQRFDKIVAEYLALHEDMIDNRLEWMAAQTLVNGAITISGESYPTVTVDFGRDPSLHVTLTGGATWDQSTSAPLEDIENASLNVRQISKGAIVTDLVMSGSAWNLLKRNQEITDLIDIRFRRDLNGATSIDGGPRTNLNEPVYVGTLQGRIDMWVYDSYYLDDNGASQPYIPANTAEIQARRSFSKSKVLFNPSGLELVTQSGPLLAPRRPNAMFVLTVK
jgi:Phage major capsid protein E